MKNQVIENLSREMGKEIIKYWQSKGVDIKDYEGSIYRFEDYRYYGVINGKFDNYSIREVEANKAEIIELPEAKQERVTPCKVFAWDSIKTQKFETYLLWHNRINNPQYPYICVSGIYVKDYEKGELYMIEQYKNIEFIDEKPASEAETMYKDMLEKMEEIQKIMNDINKTFKEAGIVQKIVQIDETVINKQEAIKKIKNLKNNI